MKRLGKCLERASRSPRKLKKYPIWISPHFTTSPQHHLSPNMACFQPSQTSLTRRNATISIFKSPSGIFFYSAHYVLGATDGNPQYYKLTCEISLLAAAEAKKKILHPSAFNILYSTLALYFCKYKSLSSSSILN